MVCNVRCFKCGEHDVRLVMGGRSIIHARCHSCESNLLAEVMEFERQVDAQRRAESAEEPTGSTEELVSAPALETVPADDSDAETIQPGGP